MSLPFLFLWASGLPRIPRFLTMRELVEAHLAWERRAGGPSPTDSADEEEVQPPPEDPGAAPPGDEAAETAEPAAAVPDAEVQQQLQVAIWELLALWQGEVVDNVPSQLLLGLGAFADRAAYLLDGLVPGHAARFARLRDLLMDHTQGGRRLPDEELHAVAAEVEVTFKEFFPPEPDAWRPGQGSA